MKVNLNTKMSYLREISHSSTALNVFAILIQDMDHNNKVATSINKLTSDTGNSKASVYSAIKLLEEKKIINAENKRGILSITVSNLIAWS